MLLEAYNRAMIYPTEHRLTTYSLLDSKELQQKEAVLLPIRVLEKLLISNSNTFSTMFKILKDKFSDQFRWYMIDNTSYAEKVILTSCVNLNKTWNLNNFIELITLLV